MGLTVDADSMLSMVSKRTTCDQGCAPELIPETHTRQKYPTFVKHMGITRPPDTHLSWGGYKPIPTHTRVLVGYVSGIFQVTNTLYQVQDPLR